VARAEAELTARLCALYASAGSPDLASVVHWAAEQRPTVWLSVCGLGDWLRPDRVAVPGEAALLAVVRYLGEQDPGPWRTLRRAAWAEAYAGVTPAGR
jgi:hypothetical protein